MKCNTCSKPAVFSDPDYCKEHFVRYFERKFRNTIKQFKLIKKNARICVAVSGGKDSLSLLYLLNKFYNNVLALAIDEGIKGYREHTLKDFVAFCKEHKIKYKIVSFKKEFGKTLDQMMKKHRNPCTVCGEKRRKLLNKYSKGFDVLATGHNLDDQAQAVLMNLFKANFSLMPNLGPKSKKTRSFTQRIKPFYRHSEKEIKSYAFLKNIKASFVECPYVGQAFRHHIRTLLNNYEAQNPGTKEKILRKYLAVTKNLNTVITN